MTDATDLMTWHRVQLNKDEQQVSLWQRIRFRGLGGGVAA